MNAKNNILPISVVLVEIDDEVLQNYKYSLLLYVTLVNEAR